MCVILCIILWMYFWYLSGIFSKYYLPDILYLFSYSNDKIQFDFNLSIYIDVAVFHSNNPLAITWRTSRRRRPDSSNVLDCVSKVWTFPKIFQKYCSTKILTLENLFFFHSTNESIVDSTSCQSINCLTSSSSNCKTDWIHDSWFKNANFKIKWQIIWEKTNKKNYIKILIIFLW